jgi:hypothetical protein
LFSNGGIKWSVSGAVDEAINNWVSGGGPLNTALNLLAPKANASFTGTFSYNGTSFTLTGANVGFEIGTSGTANNPYIDFHSGATATDYDSRIIATGGTGTAGGGSLTYTAVSHFFNGAVTLNGQGTTGSHAARKQQVDALPAKPNVVVATTTDLSSATNTAASITGKATSVAVSGTTTSGSASITGVTNASRLIKVGATVTGTGIPTSTTVLSISGTTITISNSATASGTVTLTFAQTISALVIDGVTLSIANTRILVKDELIPASNGIYILTTVGTTSTSWVLTRPQDMDDSGDFAGAIVTVDSGTINTGTVWNCSTLTNPTIGTTSITWARMPLSSEVNNAMALKQNITLTAPYTGSLPAIIPDLLAEFISGRKFGLAGQGGDETTKLNTALQACYDNGKYLNLAAGAYGVNPSNTNYCLLSRGVSIKGEGLGRTNIIPLSGVTNNHSILQITPLGDVEFMCLEDFRIIAGDYVTIRGKYGIYFLNSNAANVAKFSMRNVDIRNTYDYSFNFESNPSLNAQGCPSNSVFLNCLFNDGFAASGTGDTNSWINCAFRNHRTDRNILSMNPVGAALGAASMQVFDTCNMGGLGCISLLSGWNYHFRDLNAELGNDAGSTGGVHSCLLDVSGEVRKIIGFKLSGQSVLTIFGNSTAQRIINLGNVQGATLEGMELSMGAANGDGSARTLSEAILVSSIATDCTIGTFRSQNYATLGAGINDQGVGTRGVLKLLTPATGFANLGNGYSSLGCRKEPNGCVSLEGLLTPSSVTTGATITTLPVGFRPSTNQRVIAYATVGGAQSSVPIDILTSGVIQYQGPSTVSQLSLSGLRFQAEDRWTISLT